MTMRKRERDKHTMYENTIRTLNLLQQSRHYTLRVAFATGKVMDFKNKSAGEIETMMRPLKQRITAGDVESIEVIDQNGSAS